MFFVFLRVTCALRPNPSSHTLPPPSVPLLPLYSVLTLPRPSLPLQLLCQFEPSAILPFLQSDASTCRLDRSLHILLSNLPPCDPLSLSSATATCNGEKAQTAAPEISAAHNRHFSAASASHRRDALVNRHVSAGATWVLERMGRTDEAFSLLLFDVKAAIGVLGGAVTAFGERMERQAERRVVGRLKDGGREGGDEEVGKMKMLSGDDPRREGEGKGGDSAVAVRGTAEAAGRREPSRKQRAKRSGGKQHGPKPVNSDGALRRLVGLQEARLLVCLLHACIRFCERYSNIHLQEEGRANDSSGGTRSCDTRYCSNGTGQSMWRSLVEQ